MGRILTTAIVCSLALAGPAWAQQDINMGETYHAIDRLVQRVTSWYPTTYAVSDREPDGRVRSRLFDRATRQLLATAVYDDVSSATVARLTADIEGQRIEVAQPRVRARGTDWHNAQLQRLRQDLRSWRRSGRRGPPALVADQGQWRVADVIRGNGRRPAGAPEDEEPEAVATEYADGFALAERDEHETAVDRGRVARSRFTSRIFDQHGREVGFLRWYDKERVVTWSFPNGRRGVAMESNVPGGFKFTPTMGWANIQARAFLEQSRRPLPKGPLGVSPQGDAAQPFEGAADDMPSCGPSTGETASVEACDGRSDGCTGLHFLDDTVFRECCDRHDLCYERDAPENCCTAWSWLWPNPFWHCARCNFAAVWCFLTRGGERDFWASPGLGECERATWAEWCAPECDRCETRLGSGDGR